MRAHPLSASERAMLKRLDDKADRDLPSVPWGKVKERVVVIILATLIIGCGWLALCGVPKMLWQHFHPRTGVHTQRAFSK